MRRLSWLILLAGMPMASAQTYDPSYPVCLKVYDAEDSYIECAYISMAQCQMSASGRSAECMVDPYHAPVARPQPRVRRGHRHVH